ncbi:MAG: hypothetical protein EOO22_01650 [Comamonadaceae bacterium]|nr:MAG: hypothetical protein EOO22_01650 [Comamonadaceae bacterium]
MRRAIDHYRMMRTISQEVEAHTGVDYATCEDAINHAKAVARFIHHSDKVRNYTLPMLDLLIFYMKQYLEVKKAWDAWEPAFQRSLQSWFEGHGTESCCAGKPEPCVCYAPFSGLILGGARAGSKPAKRIAGASGTIPAVFPEAGPAPGHPDAVDIEAIIDGMTSARAKIVNEMHRSETARGNYSAVRPELTAASAGGARETPQEAVGNQRRIKLLIDTVWKQVDRPGYFSRGTRRMAHWYTRHTTSEKVGTIFSEATAMGSIFTPFTQALHVSDLAKSAVSGSIGLATTLTDKLGFGALKSADGKPLKSSLVSAAVIDEKITAEIRAHGANVQSLMPKLMLHFGRAAKALELLQASPTSILSCSDAMSLASKSMELMAQMEKVSRYAGPCLGIIDILSKACFTWSENEHRIWHEMESHLGVFLRDPLPHQVCRDTGKKCYGARHHKVGTGILGTGGKWALLNQEPHNAV